MVQNLDIIKNRMFELRNQMKVAGVDYYIIPTADSHMSEYICEHYKGVRYISGFTGDAATLLIGDEIANLWTDGRFFTLADSELEGTDITLYKMGMPGVDSLYEYLQKYLMPGQKIGVDGSIITTQFGIKLKRLCKEKNAKLVVNIDLLDKVWNDRPKLVANEIIICADELFGESVGNKLQRIREWLTKHNCDSFIFTKLDEIMWIFNIRGMDIEYNPVALSYAYVSSEEACLFLQDEAVNAKVLQYAKDNGFKILSYDKIFRFVKKLNADEVVAVDKNSINYLLYKTVKKSCDCKNEYSPAALFKLVKNEKEISQIREYFRQDSAAVIKMLIWLEKSMEKGTAVSEIDVADKLKELRSKIPGFLCESFPTIAGYADNGAIIHYEATSETNRQLHKKGMIVVDSGGQYECATTDVTRTIILGELSEEERENFSDVSLSMLRLMDSVFIKGTTGKNLDIIARQKLYKKGLNYNHGTGHGVGCCLNVHEGPISIGIRFNENDKYAQLKPGMLITDEPGFYEPGKYGIRTENTLLVCEYMESEYGEFYKFEPLTYVPIDIKGFDASKMSAEEIGLVNNYHKTVYDKVSDLLLPEEREWLKARLFICYIKE